MNDRDLDTPSPREIDRVVHRVSKLLDGKGPLLQGAVLIDVVSMYFAGHHPSCRNGVIEKWTKSMLDLIPLQEKEFFKHAPKPSDWDLN